MGKVYFFRNRMFYKAALLVAIMAALTFFQCGLVQQAMADDCLDAVHQLDRAFEEFAGQAKNINKVVDQKLDDDTFLELAEYAEKAAGDRQISGQERDKLWSMARKAQISNAIRAIEAEVAKLKATEKKVANILKDIKKECKNVND